MSHDDAMTTPDATVATPGPASAPAATTPARVGVIGAGYVGLVTGVCLAALGHTVTLRDIDPAKVQPRDLDDVRPGGLGTFLIREVMDSAEFVEPPPGCGNLLRMVKRIE